MCQTTWSFHPMDLTFLRRPMAVLLFMLYLMVPLMWWVNARALSSLSSIPRKFNFRVTNSQFVFSKNELIFRDEFVDKAQISVNDLTVVAEDEYYFTNDSGWVCIIWSLSRTKTLRRKKWSCIFAKYITIFDVMKHPNPGFPHSSGFWLRLSV